MRARALGECPREVVLLNIEVLICSDFLTGKRALTALYSSDNDLFKIMGHFIGSYEAAYKNLHEEKPITCATAGITYDAAPAPAIVVIDVCSTNSAWLCSITLTPSIFWHRCFI